MFHLIKQLFKFAAVYNKFWLIPVIVTLLMVGGLIVVAQTSTVAPFIYALF